MNLSRGPKSCTSTRVPSPEKHRHPEWAAHRFLSCRISRMNEFGDTQVVNFLSRQARDAFLKQKPAPLKDMYR